MKNLKKWLVLLAALFVLTGMMSCEMFEDDDESLAVIGTWDAGYGNTMEITSSLYKKSWPASSWGSAGSYSAKIVYFNNSDWNSTDSGSGEGSYGYFVIEWTDPSISTDKGKFDVVQWKNLKTLSGTTTMSYSEGYNAKGYFETADDAIESATSANGYFGVFSSATLK